jgi:hypothetical protein
MIAFLYHGSYRIHVLRRYSPGWPSKMNPCLLDDTPQKERIPFAHQPMDDTNQMFPLLQNSSDYSALTVQTSQIHYFPATITSIVGMSTSQRISYPFL